MTLSVRCSYRKKQPILHSFVSGVAYRIIVKPYFRRIAAFYLLVSICENTSFRRFLSFLTAGNKSQCGTLQRLTHPRQSTVSPILKPVSSPKRQAPQRKPSVLSPIPTQTSSHLRIHGTSAPSMHPTFTPPAPVAPQLRLRCALPDTPSLPKVACNSRTGVTHQHEVIQTGNILRGNCMRNCRTPHCAPEKSHVIPPGPHSPTAQKPRNTNDPISKPETSSRELRAKLQHLRPLAGHGATQARPEPNAPRPQHIRIGNKHPDR